MNEAKSREKPWIWEFIPTCPSWYGKGAPGRDLGSTYNRYAELVQDENDWILFRDADTMPCPGLHYYRTLEWAIREKPDAGGFCAMTNRLMRCMSGWQMVPESEIRTDEHDILKHWKVGQNRSTQFKGEIVDVTNTGKIRGEGGQSPWSGFFMCVKKAAWKAMGGAPEGKFSFCDHTIHVRIREAGYRVYLLPSAYIYHFYKADRNKRV